MDEPLLSNLPLQCCFGHCLDTSVVRVKLFTFYFLSSSSVPIHTQQLWGFGLNSRPWWCLDAVRPGLCREVAHAQELWSQNTHGTLPAQL